MSVKMYDKKLKALNKKLNDTPNNKPFVQRAIIIKIKSLEKAKEKFEMAPTIEVHSVKVKPKTTVEKIVKNTNNGEFFSYIDARAFFGKEVGDLIVAKCARGLNSSEKRRRDDLKGYVPYTHFRLDDFIEYMDTWKSSYNTRPTVIKNTRDLFKKIKPQMKKFKKFLS